MKKRIHRKNRDRAEWANVGLEEFMAETGLMQIDGLDTIIGDFLADLMHLCNIEKLDWNEILRQAQAHYDYELTNPND